jgi:hypothetical protein
MVFFAAVLWILSTGLTENASLVKKLLVPLGVCLLLQAGLELVYFFAFAASFSFAAALLAGIAGKAGH